MYCSMLVRSPNILKYETFLHTWHISCLIYIQVKHFLTFYIFSMGTVYTYCTTLLPTGFSSANRTLVFSIYFQASLKRWHAFLLSHF
ncbi:hypothetical protein FKM82_008674 [Ascaphus truei]